MTCNHQNCINLPHLISINRKCIVNLFSLRALASYTTMEKSIIITHALGCATCIMCSARHKHTWSNSSSSSSSRLSVKTITTCYRRNELIFQWRYIKCSRSYTSLYYCNSNVLPTDDSRAKRTMTQL